MSLIINIVLDGIFAAVAGIGFASISNTPIRVFPYCAMFSALGHGLRYFLMNNGSFHVHIVIASFMAAILIGFLSTFFSERRKCPAEVFAFPSLLPMIPGIYAYRTVQGLVKCLFHEDEFIFNHYFYLFSYNGIMTVVIITVMVVGALIPLHIGNKVFSNTTKYGI